MFFHNAVRRYKEFICCFDCQDLRKPIPTRKLYPSRKLYPFLKHILYVFFFEWLLGCDHDVDEQTIGFQGRHVYNMISSYKNEGSRFNHMLSVTKDVLTLFIEE